MVKVQKIIPISFGMVKAFLVKGDKCILVDTGLPGKLNIVTDELKKNNIAPKDIAMIVCTHNHADHVGELYNLMELTGAKIAIHKSEAESLREGKSTETKATGLLGKAIKKFFKSSGYKGVMADILVEDELILNEFGVEGRLIHTPGHTPGSLTLVLANGEIIVGDLLTGKKSGNEYKAVLPIFATDLSELKETLKKLVKLKPKSIHNSHGITIDTRAVEKLIAKMESN